MMAENKKVFFIINKFSGTSYEDAIEGRIITECGRLHIEPVIEFTQSRGHATVLAKDAAAQGFQTVFAVGGDGTVNEVAQGLLNTRTAMGILPKGSGNGLARHLGVPVNFRRSLALIASTTSIKMDSIAINDRLSVNVSGIGFDGHIAGLFGHNGRRGLAGYVRLVLREFPRYREFTTNAIIDEEKMDVDSFIVALANSSQFGNNATIAPHASVCDGLIDVCFIRKIPLLHSLGFAQKMFSNTLDRSSFVAIRKGKRASLRFEKPVAFHIDGEAHEPTDRFDVEVQPGSLRVLIPNNAGLV